MRALIEEVAADNLGREVLLDSPKQAYSQRSRFYAYIAAIKRDLTHRPPWMDDATARDLTEFLQRAMLMEFTIDGPKLIIRPRDETPFADKLRAAKVIGAPAPAADADASIATLLEKINAPKT